MKLIVIRLNACIIDEYVDTILYYKSFKPGLVIIRISPDHFLLISYLLLLFLLYIRILIVAVHISIVISIIFAAPVIDILILAIVVILLAWHNIQCAED
jgi:hypothetical protein